MKRYHRVLALFVLVAMLVCAAPALAEELTVASAAPSFRQAGSALSVYSGPNAKSSVVGKVAKNDVVLVYEQENGFTRVLAGTAAGYLSSSKLKAVSASANVVRVVQAKASTSLYADVGQGAKVGSLGKDSLAYTLMETGNYAVVKQGGTIGVAAKKDLTFFDEKTKSLGWLLYTKSADIKAGEGKSDKKLGSIAKGELVEVLYNGKNTAVVRKGKVIGAAPLSGATLYDTKTPATGTVQAKNDAAFYSGPGSKYTRQGTLKKGDQAEKLGVYSSYTVVRVDGKIGLVATKSVTTVEEQKADEKKQTGATYPAITTDKVKTTDMVAMHTKADAKSSFDLIEKGTELTYVETTKDGLWVKIKTGKGKTGYIERQYVEEIKTESTTQQATDGKLTPRANPTYHADTLAFIAVMNQYRADEGVPALKIDDVLMQAAEIRAKELAQSFSHTRPDGSTPGDLERSIMGENIGRLSYYLDYERAAEEFMKSKKGHREIALSSRHTKTGAAHYYANGFVYWVHLFA